MTTLSITAADVSRVRVDSADTLGSIAGEAISAGQFIRLDSSTGKFYMGNVATHAERGIPGFIAEVTAEAGRHLTGIKSGIINVGGALSGLNFGAPVYVGTTDGALVDTATGANEKWLFTQAGTSGSFTVSFGAATTPNIIFSAAASVLESELAALSTIGGGNIAVSAPSGTSWLVEFTGELANSNQTGTFSFVGPGGAGSVTGTTTVVGVSEVLVGYVVPGWGNGGTADKLLSVELGG